MRRSEIDSQEVVGKRVRFIKAHHSMSPMLRAHEGEEGIILVVSSSKLEVLVKFDQRDDAYGKWWIKANRLKMI